MSATISGVGNSYGIVTRVRTADGQLYSLVTGYCGWRARGRQFHESSSLSTHLRRYRLVTRPTSSIFDLKRGKKKVSRNRRCAKACSPKHEIQCRVETLRKDGEEKKQPRGN